MDDVQVIRSLNDMAVIPTLFPRAGTALPQLFRERLDNIPQHGSRHDPVVRFQERLLGGTIPFADFPEHPADRF